MSKNPRKFVEIEWIDLRNSTDEVEDSRTVLVSILGISDGSCCVSLLKNRLTRLFPSDSDKSCLILIEKEREKEQKVE